MVDMSKYLVHFSNSYDSMMGILSSGTIEPSGPFGELNKLPKYRDKTVCLSEKPFDSLSVTGTITFSVAAICITGFSCFTVNEIFNYISGK